MASSPLKSPTGEPPPSSPPLHSPSSYNSTHSFPSSPLPNKFPLQSPSTNHQNQLLSSQKSPSRDQNQQLSSQKSPSKDQQTSSQNSPSRDKNKEINHSISSQKSPLRDETKEEPTQPRKQVTSPPLSPLKFNASSPPFKPQPPFLSPLAPSPLALPSRVISHSPRNFDEEAVESPLRIVSLDQRDGQSDQTVRRNGAVRETVVWKAETRWAVIGLRILTAVFCMVSFSVMAADRTQGWDGDVYNRHNEYVYCLIVNAITFGYSSLQLFIEMHHVRTSKHLIPRPHAYYLDLMMDQILAYLLMSSSSAAASRNDIWVSRFGGDEFTRKINGSVAMSFLAFIALALSSFISTYVLVSWIS